MGFHRVFTAIGAAALVLAAAAQAQEAPQTTSYRTVTGDTDAAYSRLRTGAGWKRVVRDDLAKPQRGRSVRRTSLMYFSQLSDYQLADEESPLRVELLDFAGTPLTAAWRPQEAMVPHTIDDMHRTLNRFLRSPIRSQRRCKGKRSCNRRRYASMALSLLTGDNADNQQRNETQWVLRLLEGGRLHPNSGVESTAPCLAGVVPAGESAVYTGVQDHDDVFEGTRFYDPDNPSGEFAAFPSWPGLMDRAQAPFDVAGLRVPSYVTFGNHDGTVQGNVAANALYAALAVGCVKPLTLDGFTAGALTTSPDRGFAIPPDPDRVPVSRKEFMDVFRAGSQADGHGFGLVDPAEKAASDDFATYFSFAPKPGLRFIAINTVGEGSNLPGSQGNLDDPQFRWLEREIVAAEKRGELIVLFGHHPIRTMTNTDNDELAMPCGSPLGGPGCDGDPRDSRPIRLGGDLQALLLAHPHVIAFVAGHTHEHHINVYETADGKSGFWAIETASEVDWPIQSRLLEIMDNRDGTLSIYGTVVDHAAPLSAPPSGAAAAAFTPTQMASIARELSFNDPQLGHPGGEGKPEDRNVELLLDDPRR